MSWHAEHPYNRLPPLPPQGEVLENIVTLKACIRARAALAELKQTASTWLKQLCAIGVLSEIKFGKQKLFVHPKLITLMTQDSNHFTRYQPE